MENNIPFKLKKHLVLPYFGLRTMEDLNQEINRYKKQEIDSMVTDIKRDMKQTNGKCSYLISFVPMEQQYKLPNVTISNVEQLKDFYIKYKTDTDYKYSELWFFKKMQNKDSSMVGRISINLRDINSQVEALEHTQILEQVWSTNHRQIEKYNKTIESIFVIASRMGWSRNYNIDKITIPQGIEIENKDIIKQLRNSFIQIETYREKIEEFCEYLKKLNINEISLEYMINDGKISFIDWDSSNDKKVIKNIIQNTFEER